MISTLTISWGSSPTHEAVDALLSVEVIDETGCVLLAEAGEASSPDWVRDSATVSLPHPIAMEVLNALYLQLREPCLASHTPAPELPI